MRPDGRVLVTAPLRVPAFLVRAMVARKRKWIEGHVQAMNTKNEERKRLGIPARKTPRERRDEYQVEKKRALDFVGERIAVMNERYGFSFGTVSIRNQSTRWGSCSKRGNLNFNYKIVHLPPRLADYIVVHELCHLKEFNHSARFWDLVARAIPEHNDLRKKLRVYGRELQ